MTVTQPFNGSSVEGFQVVNEPPYHSGGVSWCHTMAEIEDEGPIAVGRDDALRLREHRAAGRQQRDRIEIALQAQRRLLPQCRAAQPTGTAVSRLMPWTGTSAANAA